MHAHAAHKMGSFVSRRYSDVLSLKQLHPFTPFIHIDNETFISIHTYAYTFTPVCSCTHFCSFTLPHSCTFVLGRRPMRSVILLVVHENSYVQIQNNMGHICFCRPHWSPWKRLMALACWAHGSRVMLIWATPLDSSTPWSPTPACPKPYLVHAAYTGPGTQYGPDLNSLLR